ncbi:SDR family NAD(P)-dependent oxidoreductase [Sporosarcina sp. 179-K 3D1 HS]|uniref:SDR family NAD(P)-dependent oxidoreductase n=1 Tax=Sporosarcina sp. 179-K 3D1 HS TaxID=3232169 RepID=UPI0039A07CE5
MSKRKSILITGATSGVGFALTKRLLAEGHVVTATGRAKDVLWELQNEGAHTIPADLTQAGEAERLVKQAGIPDVAIFSAGLGLFGPAHTMSDESIDRMLDLNVKVPMLLAKRLLPGMMERGSGQLIFIGSQAGKVSTPQTAIYAATKHAIIGYTNALRMEAVPFGVHVTTINPGPIDTPFIDLADSSGNYRKALGKYILPVEKVTDAVLRAIERPVREIDLPGYLGITSKLYAVAPSLVERLGRKFFHLKGES